MGAIRHNVADLLWQGPGGGEILEFSLEEKISEPFLMQVHLKVKEPISPRTFLGGTGTVILKAGEELAGQRPYSGLIVKATNLGTRYGNIPTSSGKEYHYMVDIRPPIWMLGHAVRSKVFQEKSTCAIVSEVLGEAGVAFSWQASGGNTVREYCLQYNETWLNFVSRLLEDEGICYFYDHRAGTTVFADNPGAHPDCSPGSTANFREGAQIKHRDDDFLGSVTYSMALGTGKIATHDYNYETSQVDLNANAGVGHPGAQGHLEIYDIERSYPVKGRGQEYAGKHGEAIAAGLTEISGEGCCRSFASGHCFTLAGHFLAELNTKWLLTEVKVHAVQGTYKCWFKAAPASVCYRPLHKTPRPKVEGMQTAIVTGPPGSKVYLDDLGRCKIQFHWDREGPMSDRSSMWVRVANNYAGKDYGVQFIPRIGHEVLVEFLEGNPDLPVVAGRVYHDANTPPLGPSDKFKNTIKSIKDHHITLDDRDGKEMFDVRSHKDMNVEVVNDQTIHIGHDQSRTVDNDQSTVVGNNQSIEVGNDQSTTVGNDQSSQIGNNRSVQVGNNQDTQIGNNQTLQVGNNQTATIGANRTFSIGSNQSHAIGAQMSVSVGAGEDRQVAAGRTTTIGSNESLSVGANMNVNVGSNQSINVGSMKSENVGSFSSESVGAGKMLNVGATYSVQVGAVQMINTGATYMRNTGMMEKVMVGQNRMENVGVNRIITVGANHSIQVGGNQVTNASGGIQMIAASQVIITVGGSKVLIAPAGVKVTGTTINLN